MTASSLRIISPYSIVAEALCTPFGRRVWRAGEDAFRIAFDDPVPMMDKPAVGTGRLAGMIGLFVLLGTPLVAYLWETLNELLSGYVDPGRLLVSLPILLLLAAHLVWLARTVRRWEAARAPSAHHDQPLSP